MTGKERFRAVCTDCEWESPITTWDKEAKSDARGHTVPVNNPDHSVRVIRIEGSS